MVSDKLKVNSDKLIDAMYACKEYGVDTLAIMIDGEKMFSTAFYPYKYDMPHVMYSATKSVMSILAGMLIDDGKLDINASVMSFFTEIEPQNLNDNKKDMTVYNLLTMTTGHDEDSTMLIYGKKIAQWEKAFLDFPVVKKPGNEFFYDSMASYMMCSIMTKILGRSVNDFAVERLFGPLNITNYSWLTGPSGVNNGGWGLYLTTDDMLKLGQLYLQKGMYDGRQIISSEYVRQSTSVHSLPEQDKQYPAYGYQWWLYPFGYGAAGMGGQRILVIPELNAVVALTMLGKADSAEISMAIVEKYILPALKEQIPVDIKKVEQIVNVMESTCGSKPYIIPKYFTSADKIKGIFNDNEKIKAVELSFNDDYGSIKLVLKNKTLNFDFSYDGTWRISKDRFNLLPENNGHMIYRNIYARSKFLGDKLIEIEMRVLGELYTTKLLISFNNTNKISICTEYQTLQGILPVFNEAGRIN